MKTAMTSSKVKRNWQCTMRDYLRLQLLHDSFLLGCSGAGTRGNSVPTPFSRFAVKWVGSCFKMAIFWMRSHIVFVSTTFLVFCLIKNEAIRPITSSLHVRFKIWGKFGCFKWKKTETKVAPKLPSLPLRRQWVLWTSVAMLLNFTSNKLHRNFVHCKLMLWFKVKWGPFWLSIACKLP